MIYNRKAAEKGVGIAAAKEAGIPIAYHNLLTFEKKDEVEYRKTHNIEANSALDEEEKKEIKAIARRRYDAALASLM